MVLVDNENLLYFFSRKSVFFVRYGVEIFGGGLQNVTTGRWRDQRSRVRHERRRGGGVCGTPPHCEGLRDVLRKKLK